MTPRVTVIGVGNPFRSDDGAAASVLAGLAARLGDDGNVRLVELDGEPVRMVQAWEGSSAVWIIDAMRSGRPPGTIHEIDARRLGELDDRGSRVGGGHLMGVGDAVELARALGLLPAELRVVGVEGANFDYGDGLSPAVADAAADLAERLATEIRGVTRLEGSTGRPRSS